MDDSGAACHVADQLWRTNVTHQSSELGMGKPRRPQINADDGFDITSCAQLRKDGFCQARRRARKKDFQKFSVKIILMMGGFNPLFSANSEVLKAIYACSKTEP
jgi:hypothetical protein